MASAQRITQLQDERFIHILAFLGLRGTQARSDDWALGRLPRAYSTAKPLGLARSCKTRRRNSKEFQSYCESQDLMALADSDPASRTPAFFAVARRHQFLETIRISPQRMCRRSETQNSGNPRLPFGPAPAARRRFRKSNPLTDRNVCATRQERLCRRASSSHRKELPAEGPAAKSKR